jgi:hypothetical protein
MAKGIPRPGAARGYDRTPGAASGDAFGAGAMAPTISRSLSADRTLRQAAE